jgi:hypothetical protein
MWLDWIEQRRLEDAENDLRELKEKRWTQKADIREELAFVVKEIRVLRGP